MKNFIKMSAFALGVVGLSGQAQAQNGTILAGVLDLPRQSETANIDGCAKVQTGLTIGGGFMLFTCEKLLHYFPISDHDIVAKRYHDQLKQMGWSQTEALDDGMKFSKYDANGCKANLSVRVWKDRAMNENHVSKRRDAFRQIVFTANYNGAACESYYPIVRAMKDAPAYTQLAAR